MPAPSDPERYDLDDMMERLQSRSGHESIEEGKLVTRADGSQAIRVRKRKRRSRQPHKERRRRVRIVQITGVVLALLLLVVGVGFSTIFINSPPFRNGVVSKLEWATGAKVDLEQFRMNPVGAKARSLALEWPVGNPLQSVELLGLSADVSPMTLFGGKFAGEEVRAVHGRVVLRVPEPGMPARVAPEPDGKSPVDFTQCGIKHFKLEMMGNKGVVIRMLNSEATLISPSSTHVPQLLMVRGDIAIQDWPNLRMDRAHLEFPGKRVEVVGMRLKEMSDDTGVVELSGSLDFTDPEDSASIKVTADAFPTTGVLGVDLGRLLSGRIDSAPELGVNNLRVQLGPKPRVTLDMVFRGSLSKPFQVQYFPFLYALSQTLGDEWFSQPEFEDVVRGHLRRSNGGIELEDLELSSKGRMSLRGKLVTDAQGALSGRLELGVARGMLAASENKVLEAMFGPMREGYRWVSLEVGGTAKSPTDNFSRLYEETLAGLRDSKPVERPAFEDLTRPR